MSKLATFETFDTGQLTLNFDPKSYNLLSHSDVMDVHLRLADRSGTYPRR